MKTCIVIIFLLNTISSADILGNELTGILYVTQVHKDDCFSLSYRGCAAPLAVSKQDYPGVLRVAGYLQADIEKVTGAKPMIYTDNIHDIESVVFIGTIGRSPIIDQLIQTGKIRVDDVEGQWESTLIQVVENPVPHVDRALVIAGSDKRGTIYGMFDLSAQIGVSPWNWWADVPAMRQENLYIIPGRYIQGPPRVKYRGVFLNDEEPALGRWVVERYGGFNSKFYEKVFELILRLKGNFLWPAMWWAAFNADDPENPRLADELGIVMSTSHHEPMMRAHAEWRASGEGDWNYETNAEVLRQFWTQGIRRMNNYESVVTLAMRGDGDMAMSDSTNIALLEKIVKDQRDILKNVTGKDIKIIPQVWALYKEVQDYYNRGMRVPEDVTLLLCDDNWGNVRRLPESDSSPRSGGYGMYYHFDFVGGPRSYKWLNTNPIPRIWEQMHLTYRHGVDRIWIVNVGDLKPMEFPISFFLDYAWNPEAWPAERLPEYTRLWAQQQFGAGHASEIAEILTQYTKFNGRRTPEMLAPDTYSLIQYREAETVVREYNQLAEKANQMVLKMPDVYRDAFYQLVLHPVSACANLHELYVTVGKNRLYAKQGRVAANDMAEKAKALFEKDSVITHYYNHVLAGGKWNHMMDQTHIGYTYWQQPDKDVLPKLETVQPLPGADMGVAVEGSDNWWPGADNRAQLPAFNKYQQKAHYIEIFNRGQISFGYTIRSKAPWLIIDQKAGQIDKEQRVWIDVDWHKVPAGSSRTSFIVKGPDRSQVKVHVVVHNPKFPGLDQIRGFVEGNGVVSMEAEHFTRAVETSGIEWQCIPDLGRTLSGMTCMPVTAKSRKPGGDSPCLEYNMHLFSTGDVEVQVFVSPTQDYLHKGGLRYAISFDDEEPQIINIHENETVPDWKYPEWWNRAVGNSIKILSSMHKIEKPGKHVLKYWMVDPGIVLQKIVVNTGGLKSCYLGPSESYFQTQEKIEFPDR
ncbi:glycosyl hydrolase 115 family protein [bacterium]|nr:glycosyl hydrolase 115 family protein [bacterium]